MSLMDLLLSGPSVAERYQQIMPLMSGGDAINAGLQASRASVPSNSGPIDDVEAAARRFFMSRGYSPEDWRKVDYIIDEAPVGAESHWNPSAFNADSGAAGLAQKITGWAPNYREDDPLSQIRWLYQYLQNHQYPGGTGIDVAYDYKLANGTY